MEQSLSHAVPQRRVQQLTLMFEPIDPFAMQNLTEYEGKKLVSAMAADLSLGEPEPSTTEDKPEGEATPDGSVVDHFKAELSAEISEVRPSKRLADSPACLVVPEGGLAPHVERMLRARNEGLPPTKRILELNLAHPLIQKIGSLCKAESGNAAASDWIHLVYDQALLAEGSPIDDPGNFAKRMTRVMTLAAETRLGDDA